MRKGLLIQFLQEFMHARSVHIKRCALLERILRMIVPDRVDLGEHVKYIEAEAIHPFVKPEVENVCDFFPHFRVLPVQICLLLTEKMQVELIAVCDPLPGGSGKRRLPVARGQKLPLLHFSFSYDVVIPVRGIGRRNRLFEPRMLRRRMVDDHVHDHFQIPLMTFCEKPVEIFHRAELLIDSPVVTDIISVVVIRRLVQRGEPDCCHAQIPDIIQL